MSYLYGQFIGMTVKGRNKVYLIALYILQHVTKSSHSVLVTCDIPVSRSHGVGVGLASELPVLRLKIIQRRPLPTRKRISVHEKFSNIGEKFSNIESFRDHVCIIILFNLLYPGLFP